MRAGRYRRSTRQRRLARVGAVALAVAALGMAAGPARAGLLTAGAGLIAVLVRLPRWESRLFDPRPASVPLRAELVTRPVRVVAESEAMSTEAHRAYAHALHAVTGAYLAEMDREAQR